MEQATGFSILLEHAAYNCFCLALARAYGCDCVTADEVLHQKVRSARLPMKPVLLRDLDL
jgi:predicted nucleic acid-binding protein